MAAVGAEPAVIAPECTLLESPTPLLLLPAALDVIRPVTSSVMCVCVFGDTRLCQSL
jgi:hypothetical protein